MSTQQSPQFQLSEEEVQRRLGRFDVTADLIEQLFGDHATPITRQNALNALVQGVYRYAMTSAKVLHESSIADLRKDFDPLREVTNKLYRERTYDKFYKKNPVFADHDKLVQDAAAEILAGQLPDNLTEEDLFERIAAATEGRIKAIKPDFSRAVPSGGAGTQDAGASGAQSTQSVGGGGGGATSAPASTAPGGFQGGGTGGSSAAEKPKIADCWLD